MGLTIGTPVYERLPVSAGCKKGYVLVTFDTSYATSGEAIVYSDIPGLERELIGMYQVEAPSGTYKAYYDSTAGKIWVNEVGAEVAGSVDLASNPFLFRFFGN